MKKTDKKPEPDNIYAYIKDEIEKSDDALLKDATATVQVIPGTGRVGVCNVCGRKCLLIVEHAFLYKEKDV